MHGAKVNGPLDQCDGTLTCLGWVWSLFFPQIALAIGVLTSSLGVRVRRFFGFVLGGLSGRVSSDVRMGEGSQILIRFGGGAVGQGVVLGVV